MSFFVTVVRDPSTPVEGREESEGKGQSEIESFRQ